MYLTGQCWYPFCVVTTCQSSSVSSLCYLSWSRLRTHTGVNTRLITPVIQRHTTEPHVSHILRKACPCALLTIAATRTSLARLVFCRPSLHLCTQFHHMNDPVASFISRNISCAHCSGRITSTLAHVYTITVHDNSPNKVSVAYITHSHPWIITHANNCWQPCFPWLSLSNRGNIIGSMIRSNFVFIKNHRAVLHCQRYSFVLLPRVVSLCQSLTTWINRCIDISMKIIYQLSVWRWSQSVLFVYAASDGGWISSGLRPEFNRHH